MDIRLCLVYQAVAFPHRIRGGRREAHSQDVTSTLEVGRADCRQSMEKGEAAQMGIRKEVRHGNTGKSPAVDSHRRSLIWSVGRKDLVARVDGVQTCAGRHRDLSPSRGVHSRCMAKQNVMLDTTASRARTVIGSPRSHEASADLHDPHRGHRRGSSSQEIGHPKEARRLRDPALACAPSLAVSCLSF